MPITRVPITHKFGIISLSQREELQDRLLKKNTLKPPSPTQHQALRNPLDLSDDFIRKFNLTSDLNEKEELEDEARKLLARAKRRAGLKDGAKGNFVDLPKAWSELSMLAQCRGKVQEECLDTLIISLHQAPLSLSHIPCLFYLAETTLYWLRTDAMNQPFLRIGEIKLLKMGYTAFLCLFYHHMAGHLHPHGELKDRLATYLSAILDGFEESEEAYAPYPGSHLCLKFIVSVGKMIVGDALMDATEDLQLSGMDYISHVTETNRSSATPVSPPNSVAAAKESTKERIKPAPVPSPYCQSSIHDLSPTLWHALDVWRCTDHLGEGFHDALRALSLCGCRLATEHWYPGHVDRGGALVMATSVQMILRQGYNQSHSAAGTANLLLTEGYAIEGVTNSRSDIILCAWNLYSGTAVDDEHVVRPRPRYHMGTVDASCAIRVIGETAMGSLPVLRVYHDLAKGVLPKSKASMTGPELEQDGGPGDLESLDSFESSKQSVPSVDSMEIKFEEMFGVKGQSEGVDEINKLNPAQEPTKPSRSFSQKAARNTSMLAYLDTPLHERLLPSGGSIGTKHSHGSSSGRTIPDISSCDESQLGSAGCMNQGVRSGGLRDDRADSDLPSGGKSYSEDRIFDATRQAESTNGNTDKPVPRGPSSLEVAADGGSPLNLPKRKSSLKGGVGRGGAPKSPSTKSVAIDPVPSTNYYTESSEGASEKRDINRNDLSSSKQVMDKYGITGWPWEVAYLYTEVLADICLYGRSANIKKIALIGNRTGLNVTMPKRGRPEDGMNKLASAGLLDLAEIEKSAEDEEDDWSWRVRYAAISGLVKISRACQRDKTLEGMGNVVWNALMIRHSLERDGRVMEAFRVGQVDAQLECEMQRSMTGHSLNFRLAAGLASTYLPPLRAPVQPAKRRPRPKVELPKPALSPRKGPTRPSLRQELLLATSLQEPQISLCSRTDLDLKRIVEDQWRKELQEQLEEEEREKQNELQERESERKDETERTVEPDESPP